MSQRAWILHWLLSYVSNNHNKPPLFLCPSKDVEGAAKHQFQQEAKTELFFCRAKYAVSRDLQSFLDDEPCRAAPLELGLYRGSIPCHVFILIFTFFALCTLCTYHNVLSLFFNECYLAPCYRKNKVIAKANLLPPLRCRVPSRLMLILAHGAAHSGLFRAICMCKACYLNANSVYVVSLCGF